MSSYRSIFAPGLLRGQVALVTGGGSGIGRCTAHELAALGAAVAIVGRKAEKLAAVQNEIEDDGGTCSIHVCDIREEPQVQSTVAAVLARHGRIDALVNNAGGQFQAPLSAISAKGWDTVVRNNLTGGFLFARECVGQWMLKEADESRGGAKPNGGAVVNIIADMWAACREWATRVQRARACSTSPRRRRWSGRRCVSMPSRPAGSHRAAWTTTHPRWRRDCAP